MAKSIFFMVKDDLLELAVLAKYIPKKCAIHSTLITTYGIKNNEYKWDFDNVITLDDLFD